jgi:hypothetical protein
MWASLGYQSCTGFCFSGYMGFFSALGLLAVAVTAPHWRLELRWWHAALAAALLLILGAGIGFGSANTTGQFLAEAPIPLGSGPVPIWGLLENKFGLAYRDARKVVPALAGLGLAAALLVAGAAYAFKRRGPRSAVVNAFLAFFLLGYALAPTRLLSLGDDTLQCGGNLIRANAQLAAELRAYISPGDTLYFHGPNSPAILVYLPELQIFPQQLNGTFSFDDRDTNADVDRLLRFGYWNEEIKQTWIRESDWILVEERRYPEWEQAVRDLQLDIVLITEPVEPACRGEGSRQILLRVPH